MSSTLDMGAAGDFASSLHIHPGGLPREHLLDGGSVRVLADDTIALAESKERCRKQTSLLGAEEKAQSEHPTTRVTRGMHAQADPWLAKPGRMFRDLIGKFWLGWEGKICGAVRKARGPLQLTGVRVLPAHQQTPTHTLHILGTLMEYSSSASPIVPPTVGS